MPSEGSPPGRGEQVRSGFTIADGFTAIRIPLAIAFVLVHDDDWRVVILVVASVSDLLDGYLARHFGSSSLGSFLDPVADKLFMAAAFGVVLFSDRLAWYEVAGVVSRDLVASVAFFYTALIGRPAAIPARLGGKAVTLGQFLTLLAFLTDSSLVRPVAWATAGIALYAIWDYSHTARSTRRPVKP
jgi:phosphatidylglycerophosphate synthase